MKCLIIDDEPFALAQLKGYIERIPFLSLTASCQDAFQASEVLSHTTVDLLFADINMPDLNGIEFVRSLPVPPDGHLYHCLFGIRHRRLPAQRH